MDLATLRKKSPKELADLLLDCEKTRFILRMQGAEAESKPQTHKFAEIKRNIARIKTVLTEMRKEVSSS